MKIAQREWAVGAVSLAIHLPLKAEWEHMVEEIDEVLLSSAHHR